MGSLTTIPTRFLVYERANGRCEYCLRLHPYERVAAMKHSGWNIDHIVPRNKGGRSGGRARENLAMACASCNFHKQSKDLGEWVPPIGIRNFWALRAVRIASMWRKYPQWKEKYLTTDWHGIKITKVPSYRAQCEPCAYLADPTIDRSVAQEQLVRHLIKRHGVYPPSLLDEDGQYAYRGS